MKKITSVALIIMILLSLICVSCADSSHKKDNKNDCKHDNPAKTEVVEAIAPTCQSTGLTEGLKCTLCGMMIVPQVSVEKVECTESEWILDYEPTADADGKKHTECVICKKVMQEKTITRDELLEKAEMTPIGFIKHCLKLVDSGSASADFLSEDTINALKVMEAIHTIANGEYTAYELHSIISNGALSNIGLTSFQINQMYGLYLWSEFDNTAVDFETMLDYMVELADDPDAKVLINEETAEQLKELADGLETFKGEMDKVVTESEFIEFGHEKFGEAWWVEAACGYVFKGASKDGGKTAKIIDVLRKVGDVPTWIIPDEFEAMIENYIYVYDVIDDSCPYTEFLPRLKKVVLALTNEEHNISSTNEDVQQAYIMYFRTRANAIPNKKISGDVFVEFVNNAIATNPTIAGQVTGENKLSLLDFTTINGFVSDANEYSYTQMAEQINSINDDVNNVMLSLDLTSEQIFSIYINYAINFAE